MFFRMTALILSFRESRKDLHGGLTYPRQINFGKVNFISYLFSEFFYGNKNYKKFFLSSRVV